MKLSFSQRLWAIVRSTVCALFFISLGAVTTTVAVAVFVINQKPDLSVWHQAYLDQEFTSRSQIDTLNDYLAVERKVFSQLHRKVYSKIRKIEKTAFNRYHSGRKSDPEIWDRNWNRTFELSPNEPRVGVLLLHGYSDSPYSIRSIGQSLHSDDAHVLGLRLPGHGTAPSGLKYTTYEDMAAAVRLGMRHLRDRLGGRPLFIIGYSNGGALAVHYTLEAIANRSLPQPNGIILLSPEIGISPVAALASWQAWIGDLIGLDKLSWNAVQPEYDPFKYGSFAVNAAEQAHRLTLAIQQQLNELEQVGRLGEIPPILAFQSVVDATVTARALLDRLFNRLKARGHQLIVFDVNRVYEAQGLIEKPINLDGLISGTVKAYDVGIVTNQHDTSLDAVLKERREGEANASVIEIELAWPKEVYSLSHIALPFAPNDPLYGKDSNSENPGVRLGQLALLGESRTLAIPNSAMTRLRWNPFYPLLSDRIRAFVFTN
jgi:alpha-beta hydrolase superfamily lysophospholipase